MPRKLQLDFEAPPPRRRLPEVGGKLGFDEPEDFGEKRRDGVHKKSVRMNLKRVKAVISGRRRILKHGESGVSSSFGG